MALYRTTFNHPYITILGVGFHKDKIDYENFTTEINPSKFSQNMSRLRITINPMLELNTVFYPTNIVIDESSKLIKLVRNLYLNNQQPCVNCVCNASNESDDEINTTDSEKIETKNESDDEVEHTEELEITITEDTESESSEGSDDSSNNDEDDETDDESCVENAETEEDTNAENTETDDDDEDSDDSDDSDNSVDDNEDETEEDKNKPKLKQIKVENANEKKVIDKNQDDQQSDDK